MLKVAICSISGKVSKEIISATEQDPKVTCSLSISRKTQTIDNRDLSSSTNKNNFPICKSLLEGKSEFEFDVAIDFTAPDATIEYVYQCVELNKPIVIGTTGFSEEQFNNTIKERYDSLMAYLNV